MNSGVRGSKRGAHSAQQRGVVGVKNADNAILRNGDELSTIGRIEFNVNISGMVRRKSERCEATRGGTGVSGEVAGQRCGEYSRRIVRKGEWDTRNRRAGAVRGVPRQRVVRRHVT